MTISVTINSITEGSTGNWQRPIFIAIGCTANIEGEVFTAPWNICMDEITRCFPEVEFVAVWAGHTCTFVPVERHCFEIDPACVLFEREV